jgi:quinol monooxygenase YgiN
MLIVAGTFEVDPDERDAFLQGRLDAMRTTRTEPGCLEYALSADPVDPSRVMLYERWADQDAFDGHMKAVQSAPRSSGPAPKGFSVKIYDIAGERAFG